MLKKIIVYKNGIIVYKMGEIVYKMVRIIYKMARIVYSPSTNHKILLEFMKKWEKKRQNMQNLVKNSHNLLKM